MSDEFKLARDTTRALHAQSLLDNETLVEAFATLEKQYIEAWLGSEPRDNDGRERLFSHVQNLRKVRDHLRRVVANGKLAEAELTQIYKEQERKKRFGII